VVNKNNNTQIAVIRLLILLSITLALSSLSNNSSGIECTDLHNLKHFIPFHKIKIFFSRVTDYILISTNELYVT